MIFKGKLSILPEIMQKAKADKIPDGWFTMEEFAEHLHKSLSTATKCIREAKRRKLIETKSFRKYFPDINCVRHVPYYKEVRKESSV